jgi:hypothetical protein
MGFNLVFLIIFFSPYLAKAAALILLSNIEPRVATLMMQFDEKAKNIGFDPDVLDLTSVCSKIGCVKEPIWRILLGLDAGGFLWFTAIALVVYNVLRALLTWRVSPMKEEQIVSDVTPRFLPPRYMIIDRWQSGFLKKIRTVVRSALLYGIDFLNSYGPYWRLHQVIAIAFWGTFFLALWHLGLFFQGEVSIPERLLHL